MYTQGALYYIKLSDEIWLLIPLVIIWRFNQFITIQNWTVVETESVKYTNNFINYLILFFLPEQNILPKVNTFWFGTIKFINIFRFQRQLSYQFVKVFREVTITAKHSCIVLKLLEIGTLTDKPRAFTCSKILIPCSTFCC